jgi:hypothetical protein
MKQRTVIINKRQLAMLSLVNHLAGSVKIPKKYKGLTLDNMIPEVKKEYFNNKYKHLEYTRLAVRPH